MNFAGVERKICFLPKFWIDDQNKVEEKFERIFRVSREMRDEILVYDSFLSKFWANMVPKCMENSVKILILGFSC